MKYPIAIEPGSSKTAWGVVVPDLPGCFSAADGGIDEAIEKAKEAIELWIEIALDNAKDVPKPSLITDLQKKKEFKGFIWAIVEINPALLSDDIERVNISLPKRVLARLDAKAKSAGENRSGYIAHMAIST
ncbi:type II toxin-antitoxin system HicB family antitoxin [Polynucleobacter sphagniphilus]|jgi:predicted RNase H-like HicB family nuclease|uniref:RNase H-like HicB family nuclease n=1 Tax=Polynucleobacter sphagniphilus TaxID=1743169 RepID=A0AA43MB19_9BURK|nr:type II toxin-antitoxin system HicB family antitoxin [Polynucleobacter sphagniphilus]MDF9787555.1 putative RNase H-like HicB family nuclease [Polynucleobacter sphagniphilus]MDH6240343.1 putative RNase H-like HicB family nuclease [Polynucleobacter sphagniphilus]MDH6248369.1 putative RNase H-like HicB family nuclease [Polynucleobacter sphagniphilus]MDH6300818.1 putative RNase H-like HicB family nuclease [Polynucleobacter sphagniphilus]MDH6303045.1 putative RNase H-like HicB family nuclease [P